MPTFTEKNTEIIVAGPGVGKTTCLLDRIEEALGQGVNPDEIAFFSFSTTAVNEGIERITTRMKYNKNQFKYFRTLHSMAFNVLGLNTKQVVTGSLMYQFAKENDLKLNVRDWRTGIVRYQTSDSILLSQLDSARLLGMSVREYFTKNHIDSVPISRAEELAAAYQKFKVSKGVVDFTDMILFANKTDFESPHFKYMFIDEAQDLSTQQWRFVEKMSKNADNIIIVGDERQAIAGFSGADVDYFLNIEGKITELNRSYRVPPAIYKVARKVERHMKKVRGTMWYPRKKEFGETGGGEVIRVSELPIREMATGSWLLMTRTNAQLTELKDYMMQYCNTMPAFFTVDGLPPVDTDVFKAIHIFEAINISDKLTKYDFIIPDENDDAEKLKKKAQFTQLLKKFMSSSRPNTPEADDTFLHRFKYRSWFDAFDRLPLIDRKYVMSIREMYDKHPDGFVKAKIRLSTIHSAKGMEADNVVLYMALTPTVYKEWQDHKEHNDEEVKVLFVGVTRAKKRLYLLGRANMNYSYMELLE